MKPVVKTRALVCSHCHQLITDEAKVSENVGLLLDFLCDECAGEKQAFENAKPVVLDELNEFFGPERRIETDPRELCITPIKRSKPRKKKPRREA